MIGTKRAAILGSSGGNLFHSGGGDPKRLLAEIASECRGAGIEVAAAQFVAAQGSMDQRAASVAAELYEWNESSHSFLRGAEGSLEEINREAARSDEAIALLIEEGRIDGLILLSCDPHGANRLAVAAAAKRGLPVVGTGGTSMGEVKSLGANVVSLSGTTGTTNQTRAVAFALALSRYWKLSYRMAGSKSWREARISGVMTSSIPAFMAVLLLFSLSNLPFLSGLDKASAMLSYLPLIVLAVFAARQMADLGEATLIAGIAAGFLSADGGVVGVVLAGLAAGWLTPRVFQLGARLGFPATSVHIATAVLSGVLPGLVMFYGLGEWTMRAADAVRDALEWTVGLSSELVGCGFGLAMWPLIRRGWYHTVLLPLMLLEMERYGNSFIGALDMAGLVMTSAGILLAQLALPVYPADRNTSSKPFWLNVGFGTFIEASYVFMQRSRMVSLGAILASGFAGAVIGGLDLRSTAYVPFYLALLFSNDALGFLAAMLASLAVSFLIALAANIAYRRKRDSKLPNRGKEERHDDL
ncbi:PTS sugar transporter [Cohnella sp. AR92]|uniref:PTS sugar transporter n=1 Tax=Cohnella sp. AR92 TaxID=648716 RepID=UPI000F8E22E8|nr:PTS sugar transporter [Cohnella sp. AR92]RUS46193.1 PTS sugar transporter [Cohnella sp. AR92]